MPTHIVRLISLLAVVVVGALVGRAFFTDPSFYRFGHYRADAVPELAAAEPKIRGSEHCQSCHAETHLTWSESTHRVVQCEACHGAAREHPDGGVHRTVGYELQIPEDPVRLCSQCHEAMPARPASHPQIVLGEHPFPSEVVPACTQCHDAHSPGFGAPVSAQPQAAPADEASEITALITSCGGCHGDRGQGIGMFPPLAGKGAGYLAEEMNKYKSGARQDPMMNAIAQPLSESEIVALAEHYAEIPGE